MHSARSHPTYRADIDGLRAIAVLCVIAFHAFPDVIQGGFIGVDIFFVISGFLISTIIFGGLEKRQFSFLEFYARRIRRIFPALILVLIATFTMGWFVLLTEEYKALGKHVSGAMLFISNFVLVKEAGYFDAEAITKPLLHLWSLAIEEQFYIVWPMLLWGLWKLRQHKLWIILLIAFVLFAWNILRMTLSADPTTNFYLPQARCWELLIGASLAYATAYPASFFERIQLKLGTLSRISPSNIQSLLGALLIVASVAILSKNYLFPGFWALLPTLGAALVISAGAQGVLNRTLLAQPLLVFIGVISYPLYLWHWPLLSFAQIIVGDTPSTALRVACIIVAFVLAWATYWLAERPLRFGRFLWQKTILLVLVMGAIGWTGNEIYQRAGLGARDFAQRTQPLAAAVRDWGYPGDLVPAQVAGVKTVDGIHIFTTMDAPPRVLFFGDSHIEQYGVRVLRIAKQQRISAMFLTGGGCPALPNIYAKQDAHCFHMFDNLHQILAHEPTIKTVVIGNFWNAYLLKYKQFYYLQNGVRTRLPMDGGQRMMLAAFGEFVAGLTKKYRVYVVLDNPAMPQLKPEYIANRLTYVGLADLPASVPMLPEQVAINNRLRAVAEGAGAVIIDPLPQLCPNNQCVRIGANGLPMYKDADHLGAHYVRENAAYIDKTLR